MLYVPRHVDESARHAGLPRACWEFSLFLFQKEKEKIRASCKWGPRRRRPQTAHLGFGVEGFGERRRLAGTTSSSHDVVGRSY